ncbi:MAG: ATP-binding protein [candidate division KSB1 bacterium]|nr:ATP-binding protein [candidate division KSB1 bacterium]
MFINREKELQILENRYGQGSQLFILYGRRRVGKTELIKQFIRHKPYVYYMADRRTEREQLQLISNVIADFFQDEILRKQPLASWDLVFTYLHQHLQPGQTSISVEQPLILVLDEFPYLVEVNHTLPSILQKYWDETLKNLPLYLILCGSSLSFMERELLSYKSPLYGRRTGQLELLPFDYRQIKLLFPDLSPAERLMVYAIFGGIPAYLLQYRPEKSLEENIVENILAVDRILYHEVRFVLMEELRAPQNYFAILRALSFGKNRLNEIVQTTGLERGVVGKYLDLLIQLRLVERKVPVTESKPLKSRKGLYRIRDNFFRFWFRFIYPYLTYLEEGNTEYVLSIIRDNLPIFVSTIFEEVCIQFLKHNLGTGRLPFEFTAIGAWWERDTEIDLVAFSPQGEYLFGECKWSLKPVGINVLDDLKKKASRLNHTVRAAYYILFSRSGFTEALRKKAAAERVYLFDITDMDI